MEAKINISEAASKLASEKVKEYFHNELVENNHKKYINSLINDNVNSDNVLEEVIYKEDENGITYTNEAQDIFNGFYDYYEDLLLKCKI